MSNVIKAYTVCYDVDVTKTIDTHLRKDSEIQLRRKQSIPEPMPSGEFVEGLKAVKVEQIPAENEENLLEKSKEIIENAQNEAKLILEEAKREAQQVREQILSDAQSQGYEQGVSEGQQEMLRMKAEYEAMTAKLQKDYERLEKELEPKFVHIISSLIEKITGVIVEDKEEIIYYLVDKALMNMDKCNEYAIRVSSEDYEYLNSRKSDLLNAIHRDVKLNIVEDTALSKNQCLIETDLRMIDCSLDVQLNNLITDLKLLGGI